MTTIGLLHPGEMGASVGAAARAGGARVLWASQGRSTDTWARAATAELDDAGSVAALAATSDVVLSVCPPHGALDIARAVAATVSIAVSAMAASPKTTKERGAVNSASEIEIEELGGVALAHRNRDRPEQPERRPEHFRPDVAHRRPDATVIVEAVRREEHPEQNDNERVLGRVRRCASPGSNDRSRQHAARVPQ